MLNLSPTTLSFKGRPENYHLSVDAKGFDTCCAEAVAEKAKTFFLADRNSDGETLNIQISPDGCNKELLITAYYRDQAGIYHYVKRNPNCVNNSNSWIPLSQAGKILDFVKEQLKRAKNNNIDQQQLLDAIQQKLKPLLPEGVDVKELLKEDVFKLKNQEKYRKS